MKFLDPSGNKIVFAVQIGLIAIASVMAWNKLVVPQVAAKAGKDVTA